MELCSYMYSGEANYAMGMNVLAYSLKERGKLPYMTWNIIWSGDPIPGVADTVGRFGFKVVERSVSEFDIYGPMKTRKLHLTRGEAWNKLAYLLMPEGKRYAFIDVDILCLSDARGMLDMRHFSCNTVYVGKRIKKMSTHFYVASPTRKFYKDIAAIIPERDDWFLYDESLLTEYFDRHPADLKVINDRWNVNKREEIKIPKNAFDKRLREGIFLHYPGLYKPWFDGTWDHQPNEKDHPRTHALWHAAYKEATGG